MVRFASLGVVAVCGLPLCAQTSAVVPPANATIEGDSIDPEPFGFNQITHLQYVDRSLLTAVPGGTLLRGIAYRRDWNASATVATMQRLLRGAPAPAIWEILMQNYAGPVLNPSTVIQRTGWTTVLNPILVNFPDLPRGAGPTANFDLSFVFDVPFLYSGGALGVSHRVYEGAGNTFNYAIDAVTSPITSGSVDLISPTALGCPVDSNRCEGFAPNPGAGDLEFYLYGSKPSSLAVSYLGTNTTNWLSTPLPLSLGFLGLAGCSVYTDLALPIPRATDITGGANVRVAVPADAALTNARLYGQWVAVDDRVNPAVNLATSDGLAFTLGPTVGGFAVPMSIVSAAQNLALGRTGYVRRGEGAVFRLNW